MGKAIDVWFNLISTEMQKKYWGQDEIAAASKTEHLDRQMPSILPDDLVARMDEAGVEVTMLAIMKQGHSVRMKLGEDAPRMVMDINWRDALPYYEKYPKRFRCLYGINPWTAMDGVKEMQQLVQEYDGFFCGAMSHTAGFAPFNDKIWYPFYAKCAELDIPIITQCGHFAESLREAYCHPLQIDEVAEYFPELPIIAGHTGWPWTQDLQGVVLKNPNVYFSMEAHLPKYWDASMIQFMNSRGKDRCMWGSDWPVTEQGPNLEQVAQVGIKDKVMPMFLRENAIRVFKLDI